MQNPLRYFTLFQKILAEVYSIGALSCNVGLYLQILDDQSNKPEDLILRRKREKSGNRENYHLFPGLLQDI